MKRGIYLLLTLTICLATSQLAGRAAAEVPTSNIPASADCVVSFNVRATRLAPSLRRSEIIEMLAAPVEEYGIKLSKLNRLDLVYHQGQRIGVIARFSKSVKPNSVGGEVFGDDAEELKLHAAGGTFTVAGEKAMYAADDKTYVFASRKMMPRFVVARGTRGPVAKYLAASSDERHLLMIIRPRPDLPSGAAAPYQLWGRLAGARIVKFKADLDPKFQGRLTVVPIHRDEADKVRDELDTTLREVEAAILAGDHPLVKDAPDKSKEPLTQLFSKLLASSSPKVSSKGDVTCNFLIPDKLPKNALAMAAQAMMTAKEAIPSVAGTEAERTNTAMKMKNIVLAMHNHHDGLKKFPGPRTPYSGKSAQVSWRLRLTPYLELRNVYDDYRTGQEWNSDTNKKHHQPTPDIFANKYRCSADDLAAGKTNFVALVGEETAFPPDQQLKHRDLSDGSSQTIMLVECDPSHAVPWLSPQDIEYDASDPLKGLPKDGFFAGFADTAVLWIPGDIDPKVFHALVTRSGDDNDVASAFFQ